MPIMSKLDTHPSVLAVRQRPAAAAPCALSLADLRALALEAGADDVSVVSLDHPDLAEEKPHALAALPSARTFIALVQRTLPADIRSPKRSVANHEFHRTRDELDEIARRLAQELTARGHSTLNPPLAFPMEMSEFPGRTWIVSHKRVAVAAQLGRMGLHRNVIHPRLGSFVLLGTLLTSAEFAEEPPKLTFDPCVDCRLCVAACPVGAIEADGGFRFSACYDHNYREFMSGFSDFVEQVVESDGRQDFRERMPLNETVSTWQSLAYGPNYKAAYCIAVCPAGEDVLGPFLESRAGFLDHVVRPLTERVETVYAVRGSDAAAHVAKRFPHKRLRLVESSLRPTDARAFFRALPLIFQRGPARGWNATFHFELTGEQAVRATVRIDDGKLEVDEGVLDGEPDVRIESDGALWIDVVNRRKNPVLATLTGRLKLRGDRGLLERFSTCFPR